MTAFAILAMFLPQPGAVCNIAHHELCLVNIEAGDCSDDADEVLTNVDLTAEAFCISPSVPGY